MATLSLHLLLNVIGFFKLKLNHPQSLLHKPPLPRDRNPDRALERPLQLGRPHRPRPSPVHVPLDRDNAHRPGGTRHMIHHQAGQAEQGQGLGRARVA